MTISGLYVGSLLANLNARAYVKDGHVTWNEFTSVFPDDSNVPLGAIGAQQTSGGRTYTADIEVCALFVDRESYADLVRM